MKSCVILASVFPSILIFRTSNFFKKIQFFILVYVKHRHWSIEIIWPRNILSIDVYTWVTKLQVSFGIFLLLLFFCSPFKNQISAGSWIKRAQGILNTGTTYVPYFSWLEIVAAGVGNISTAQHNFPDNADGSSFIPCCLSKEIVQWTEIKHWCFQHQTFTISILKEKEITNFTFFGIDKERQMKLLCKFLNYLKCH